MQVKSTVGVITCALIMLGGAGCGGGGDRLSAPGYAREASRICASANRQIDRMSIPPAARTHSIARMVRRILVIERASVDGLRGLRPPTQLGSLTQRWIALLDQTADELELLRGNLTGREPARAAEYAAHSWILSERARALVAPHGVTSCRVPRLPVT